MANPKKPKAEMLPINVISRIAPQSLYGFTAALEGANGKFSKFKLVDHKEYPNPRITFDPASESSKEIIENVADNGLNDPINVTQLKDGTIVVLDGRTRLYGVAYALLNGSEKERAAAAKRFAEIPVLAREMSVDQARVYMANSNFLRRNLTDLEMAGRLVEFMEANKVGLPEAAAEFAMRIDKAQRFYQVAKSPTAVAAINKGKVDLPTAAGIIDKHGQDETAISEAIAAVDKKAKDINARAVVSGSGSTSRSQAIKSAAQELGYRRINLSLVPLKKATALLWTQYAEALSQVLRLFRANGDSFEGLALQLPTWSGAKTFQNDEEYQLLTDANATVNAIMQLLPVFKLAPDARFVQLAATLKEAGSNLDASTVLAVGTLMTVRASITPQDRQSFKVDPPTGDSDRSSIKLAVLEKQAFHIIHGLLSSAEGVSDAEDLLAALPMTDGEMKTKKDKEKEKEAEKAKKEKEKEAEKAKKEKEKEKEKARKEKEKAKKKKAKKAKKEKTEGADDAEAEAAAEAPADKKSKKGKKPEPEPEPEDDDTEAEDDSDEDAVEEDDVEDGDIEEDGESDDDDDSDDDEESDDDSDDDDDEDDDE